MQRGRDLIAHVSLPVFSARRMHATLNALALYPQIEFA